MVDHPGAITAVMSMAPLRWPRRVCVIRQASVARDPRVLREVRALLAAGHVVDVISLRDTGEPLRERDGRLTHYRVPLPGDPGNSVLAYGARFALFAFIATLLSGALHLRRRYALVQVHTLPDVLVFAAVIPRLLGAKVILDLHETMVEFFTTKYGASPGGPAARLVAAAEQASIRFADLAFTCTNEMREAFIGRGADPEHLGVVLNASPEDVFDVARHPPRGSAPGEYVVMCHGTVEERYGIETAIRAIALLGDEIPGLRLEVCGMGTYLPEARRRAHELGVADRVRLNGRWMPIEELLEAIATCDAGLVAMKRDAFRDLTHCNKMYDLITMRRPVLMSRTRSVENYFGDDCFEYFDADNPERLADAIRRLHADPARAEQIVATATSALEPYRWARQREIYLSYVDALVSASSNRGGEGSDGSGCE